MKKIILLLILFLSPLSARADFNLIRTADVSSSVEQRTGATSSTAVQPTAVSRQVMRPSLEIINDRYVPDSIKQKYKMTDDYVEMTEVKPESPIVVSPPDEPKKKRLEIMSGPPPVTKDVAPTEQVVQAQPIPQPVPVPVNRIDTWRARQGEVLKDVLKRWADRAGTDFVWTAAESPKISHEYSYVGTFEKAVNGLMRQDSGTLKMKFSDGNDIAPPTMPTPIVADDGADMRVAPAMAGPVAQPKSWFAANGSSLQGVLRAWAEMEGATLVWQTPDNFSVLDSVNEKGSFEKAVGRLLSKYETKKTRPVGQLYKNPVSGEKLLVIKTDKNQ